LEELGSLEEKNMNKLQTLGLKDWFWKSSARSPLDIPSGKNKLDLSKTPDFKSVKVFRCHSDK
jgi:hypothetical protein